MQQRTAELAAEIEQRKQHQQEKDKLLEVVRQQSEQQRTLTLWLMEMQQQKQHALAQTLQGQTEQRPALLRHNLELIEAMVANSEFVSPTTATLIARQAQDSLDLLARTQADLQAVATNLNQPAPEQTDPTLLLTGRELEILQLLAGGKSVAEIAALLYISPPTVYGHRRSLMDKLGVDNLPELLRVAARRGLTP